jgi:hypothetical protein
VYGDPFRHAAVVDGDCDVCVRGRFFARVTRVLKWRSELTQLVRIDKGVRRFRLTIG